MNNTSFGQTIFWYIHAPLSGYRQFSISSDDFSELWLRSGEGPQNASLICYLGGRDKRKGTFVLGWTKPGEFKKYESPTSRRIHLEEGR